MTTESATTDRNKDAGVMDRTKEVLANGAKEAKEVISSTAKDAKEGASHLAAIASEGMHNASEGAKSLMHDANNTSLADLENKAISYVKENPGRTVLGAALTGLVIGFLLRRS